MAENRIPPTDQPSLELGCGTGRSGLVAFLYGFKNITLTDYHPAVLSNVQHNIHLNHLPKNSVQVAKLDWRNFDLDSIKNDDDQLINDHNERSEFFEILPHQNLTYHTIFAADSLYDPSHAILVPLVVNKLLKRNSHSRFYTVQPLRRAWSIEITSFIQNMEKNGFMIVEEEDIIEDGGDDGNRYRWWIWKRKEIKYNSNLI